MEGILFADVFKIYGTGAGAGVIVLVGCLLLRSRIKIEFDFPRKRDGADEKED